jgi:hypothetical protein
MRATGRPRRAAGAQQSAKSPWPNCGNTNAELARALGTSPHTAERHTERVLARLGVRSRHDVAARLRAAADDAIAEHSAMAA